MCLCHMADAILGYNLTNSDLFSDQYDKFVKPIPVKRLKRFVRTLCVYILHNILL